MRGKDLDVGHKSKTDFEGHNLELNKGTSPKTMQRMRVCNDVQLDKILWL